MAFDEIFGQIGDTGSSEDNSGETLVDDAAGQADNVGEGDDGSDNSEETGQQVGFDPNSITDPQLQAAYKQMQAAFTPRLQEAAKLREQYSDLDPGVVEAVRHYQGLLRNDPIAAREFLAQQQQWIEQQVGLQQQQDPFAGVEPLTGTEKALLEAGRAMWQRMQQQDVIVKQQQFARQAERVERQFAQLESKYKVQIPVEERHDVWNFMSRTGVQDVDTAWKALNFDKAMNKGAQKALQTNKQKQRQPAAPAPRHQRSAPQAATRAKGIAGHFEEAWNAHSGE